MTNSAAITNFMYFANNYSLELLDKMFSVTSAPEHLKEKFYSIVNIKGNGTEAFFQWFMELSQSNKDAVCIFITEYYSYK